MKQTISDNVKFNLPLWGLLIMTIALITFVSCANKSNSINESVEKVAVISMDVDSLLFQADKLVDDSIQVEGVCTHICSHGGRKIFLMGSDDTKTLRIEGAAMGKFDSKCVNNMVLVTGILREQRIDEAYLQGWELQVAEQVDENHGEDESGCSTEKKARNESGNSAQERIVNFRQRIAERERKEGKPYLSFYYVEAQNYKIIE